MFNNLRRFCLSLVALTACAAASGQSPPQAGGEATDAGAWRADRLVVVPQKGQTAQQLWADRYACDAWAKSQSGYDSNRPAGSEGGAASPAQRSSYRSATIACLQAKGYEVRDASQPAPSPGETETSHAAPPATPRFRLQTFEPTAEFQYHPLTAQIEGGYTVTQDAARNALQNGWNAGLGFTLTPIAGLPLALRVDGSYSRFNETNRSLQLAAQQTGANGAFIFGRGNIYGGDTDAQLDLKMGPTVREYFFGGIGWYREQTSIKEVSFEPGVGCFYSCFPAYFPVVSTVERSTTGWLHSWNAGMGFEFALEPPGSFFIEARYLRIGPANDRLVFVPIRFGLRF